MRTILCYGDSNTWGYDPAATASSPFPVRHSHDARWTAVLARELGAEYRIVEEGQNGRTTAHDDPTAMACRNGRKALPTILESQKPIDIVVLMLGTNDFKTMFNLPAADIANSVAVLVKILLLSDAGPDGKAPRVLLVAPPAIGDLSHLPDLDARLAGAREKSLQLPRYYAATAKQLGISFVSAQDFVQPSRIDGIHLDCSELEKLGRGIAAAVKAMA